MSATKVGAGMTAARLAVLTRPRPKFFDDPARACADTDASLFFSAGTNQRGVDRVKAICRRCPFETECREYAIERYDEYGIWGATTFKDRAAIRRQRKQAGR